MSALTSQTELTAARLEAIEQSGWGRSFTFVQPRNFTFWVLMLMLVAGVVNLYEHVLPALQAHPESLTQGTVIFGIYLIPFVWLLSRLDRYSSIPGKAVLTAFVFGGVVATFAMAVHFNDALRSIVSKTLGTDFSLDWGAALAAPISEETTKAMAVVVIIGLAPSLVRCAFDGFILGAFAGLAFQVFEDVTYVYTSTSVSFGEEAAGLQTAATRAAFGFSGHWMWSAIVGAGLIYLIGRPAEPRRRLLGLALILAPMGLHAVWDAPGAIGGGSDAAGPLILVAAALLTLILFVWTYRHTVPRERQWMRDVLAPEASTGVLSAEEIDAAAGRRKARRRFIKQQGGRDERRRMKHVLEAASDLADQIAADRGVETAEVQQARAEVARVRG